MTTPQHRDYRHYVNEGWMATLEALGEAPLFCRAQGDCLYDAEDNAWYDFIGHYGAALFGHHYPPLHQALADALSNQIPAGAPLGFTGLSARLAQRLIEVLALKGEWNNWTLSTGAEAVEGALKIAATATGRDRILARTNAFHGLSALTLQLNDVPYWKQGYETLTEERRVDFFDNVADAARLLATHRYAALILEPVQAIAGGRQTGPQEAALLRNACNSAGTLFIVDEIFTGMGRCGHYSAMQALSWQVQPDIILLAKTLTGAFMPSAQLLVRRAFFSAFNTRPGCAKLIASTFTGNGLGQAVALAVIDQLTQVMNDDTLQTEQRKFAARLSELARAFPACISGVSSTGLLHFIHFSSPELTWKAWSYLYANRILTTLCGHRPDTLKIICSVNQSDGAQSALYDVIHHVCGEECYGE